MKVTAEVAALLACPRTHQSLKLVPSSEASGFEAIGRDGFEAPQFGLTDQVLVSESGTLAYPVKDDYPALLWPEVLLKGPKERVDLQDRRYWEAYAEMEFYNPVARRDAANVVHTIGYGEMMKIVDSHNHSFPDPPEIWISPCFDIESKIDCDHYLGDVKGKTVLQLGGQGREAIRLLLAGAAQGILVTPMVGECELAWSLAEKVGVRDRLSCILGIGEEIPLRDGAVDAISSQGCLHHMRLELAAPEIHRVLKPGGRFVAMDPFRTPLYAIGTRIVGKREQGLFDRSQSIFCKPLTDERIAALAATFPNYVVKNHGAVLRYPLLALNKLGIRFPPGMYFHLSKLDEWLGKVLHINRRWGGSVMVGAQRQ